MSVASFKSISVARRLALGFASILALLVAVASISALALHVLNGQVKQIVEVNDVKISLANRMLHNLNEMGLHARTVSLLYDVKQIEQESGAVKVSEAAYLKAEASLRSALESASSNEDERKLYAEIVSAGQLTLPPLKAAVALGVASDHVAAVSMLTDKVRPSELVWSRKLSEFIAMQSELVEQATATAATTRTRAFASVLTLVVLALAMGSLIAWRITLGVTRPIRKAVVVAERIAQGDLTSTLEVRTQDETGRLLQAIAVMQERLQSLVGGIRHTAESIQLASSNVATGSRNLSGRTEQAASNLRQTALSMQQLTGTLKQSSDAAHQANQLASSAADVAARGGAMVAQVVTTMDEINASSQKIADIVGVIDGLAFQTNILALNAAVEAARSGEQGRGFAVVAGEVRNLAARSAEAAKEIRTLIGSSVERVDAGFRLVRDAGKTMTEIVGSVKRVSDIVGEITAASSEQTDGINQINSAVVQLDDVTQKNAKMGGLGVSSAENLKTQANRLAEMVGMFRLQRESA